MTIHDISPFRSDKNIGRANNETISKFNDDDWIVLTDGDASWMLPNWGELVEKVINNNPEFDLIGCSTNRLGGLLQLHNGTFDTQCIAYDNYDNAIEAWEKFGTFVEPIGIIAGLCMIFKKSTWEKAGGFVENSRMADVSFCKAVKKSGGKIGIARGLYMMHNYRIWERERKQAKTSIKHLVK